MTTRERNKELEWLRFINPVTEHFADRVRATDLSGTSISCWMHLLPDTVLILEPFVQAGAQVRIGACNPDSTNRAAVAAMRDLGIEVHTGQEDEDNATALRRFVEAAPDVLCDMGGELAEMAVHCGARPIGGLEATITGLHRLARLDLPFPVFDWNSVAIKDALHNRYHVGAETWPAFTAMTGIGLFGRAVLVIGFGPVGRGVAERARNLGAVVMVAELDPVRRLEAMHFGCEVVPLPEGLARAEIAVTATGLDGILTAEHLTALPPGAIVFNVGHSNREIDVDGMLSWPNAEMKAGIRRFDREVGPLYLLNNGSMVNLGLSSGLHGSNAFDPFAAIMVAGMHWILTGQADGQAPGLHPYPDSLMKEIAEATLTRGLSRSGRHT